MTTTESENRREIARLPTRPVNDRMILRVTSICNFYVDLT